MDIELSEVVLKLMDSSEHTGERLAVALTVADVMGMDLPLQALQADREGTARAAMDKWGLSGVGVRHGNDWAGVALVAPQDAIPQYHPLSAGGIDCATAGLILIYVDPTVSSLIMGKRLCVALTRYLRTSLSGIEAQGMPTPIASTLAPPATWLVRMGFHAVRYPTGRYRLDFDTMVTWMQKYLQWYRRPVIGLAGQPANRTYRLDS